MDRPRFVTGLAGLAGRYSGMIVDQWGVLHDGSRLIPAALDALRRLRDADLRVILLSNTGRRLAFNRERLARMGLEEGLVEDIVTSGETAWSLLRERRVEPWCSLPRRCLLWSEGHDRSILDGLDLDPVEDVAAAGFILLAGIPEGAEPDDFETDLARAADRGVPMVCCNPDRVVVTAAGVVPATGSLAARYETMGGVVHYVGKPHPPVYERCLAKLGLPRERVLAVGDSLEHDIAGGVGAGLRTALVMGGIHADAFDLDGDEAANRAALETLTRDAPTSPDWVMPRFRW